MKNIYLLLVSMLAIVGVNAQTASTPHTPSQPNNSHSRSQAYKEIGQREDQWDNPSSTWSFSDSTTYSYDQLGNQSGWLAYNYQTPAWVNYTRTTYTYDANNKPTSRVVDQWVPVSSSYVHYDQDLYTNDANGNNIHYLHQTWDAGSNNWLNAQQYTDTYNGQNQRTESVYQQWLSGNWQNQQKDTYTYTAGGKIETDVRQTWASGAWVNDNKTTNMYLPNDLLDSLIMQNWDGGGSTWQNYSNGKHQYDANGNDTAQTFNIWRTSSNSFDSLYEKNTYAYDSHNNELSYISKYFSSTTGQLENSDKYLFTYNADNERDTFIQFGLSITNQFIPEYKTSYLYDSNRNNTYHLIEVYNTTNLDYENGYRAYYYYALENSTGIGEMHNDLGVTMFPNPAGNNGTNIRFNNEQGGTMLLNIYDLNGRLVSTEQRNIAEGENTITTADNVPAGIYIIQLSTPANGKSSVMKLVKQ